MSETPDVPRCVKCGEERLLDHHATYYVCRICCWRWLKAKT